MHVAIVGCSLGGLSVANVLNRLSGMTVEIFESFEQGFHFRGGALGGVDVDLVHRLRGTSSTSSSKEASYKHIRNHGHFYGDLWSYFYEAIPSDKVHFGTTVDRIEETETSRPTLVYYASAVSSTCSTTKVEQRRQFDLIIGADGGKSVVRPFVTEQRPTYAGYTLFRGLCPVAGIPGPPSGHAKVEDFTYQTLGFPVQLLADGGKHWNCGVYMAMPEEHVAAPTRNRQVTTNISRVPEWFVPFVRTIFGEDNGSFWEACVKHGKVSPHPVWEMKADTVVNHRVVLLGDAAHMASPRTGAGAYTAMIDAEVLGKVLEKVGSFEDQDEAIDKALGEYNHDTVRRGEELYKQSRAAASYFAPRGRLPTHPKDILVRLAR
jgi:2-polyprenyl-6-methoxyphenol hydroxylase-like FAD-dependent oxidoreductase